MDLPVRTADPSKIQRILEAAAQLFVERHYHEVRMDDVAAKAGVAKGTIYFHFKDKDDLYQALTLDSLKKLNKRIREALQGLEDPAAKLLRFSCEVIRYFESNACTLDLITHVERLRAEESLGETPFRECRDEISSLLRSIFEEFPEAKHRNGDDVSLAVLSFMGTSKEVLRQLPRPWPADLPERLTRQLLNGFLGVGTAGSNSG
jgi:AcrR family transcriptional regulator